MQIPELNRINELARKAKQTALSSVELAERHALRKRYLLAIRGQLNHALATVTVVDPLGNDVTPLKLRQAQRSGMMTN
ncbi:DUF896 domain-containing protein [Testudinibacter sp. P80/BLE/0925]|uniref:DUF896 domain-containing protein n=1 Tax=Testudinibacter sp. TW-1 TaxID=3417757 RepID=UPI003D362630